LLLINQSELHGKNSLSSFPGENIPAPVQLPDVLQLNLSAHFLHPTGWEFYINETASGEDPFFIEIVSFEKKNSCSKK